MAAPFSSRTGRVALGGFLTAGAFLTLYLASVAPSGRFGLAALAGIFPVFAVLLSGRNSALLVWGASSLLGLFIVPNKGIVLCYALILGVYPIIKHIFETLNQKMIEWAFKFIFSIAALTLLRYFLLGILMYDVPSWISQYNILFFLVGMIFFVLYDIALSRLIAFLVERIIKRN